MYTTNNDIKSAASNIRDEAVSTAYSVKNDVHDAAANASSKVRSLFNYATDELTHASDSVTKQIRSNPVQSTAAALGAGFILGLIFRR